METVGIPRIYRSHQRLFRNIPQEVVEKWQRGSVTLAHMLTCAQEERSAEEAIDAFQGYLNSCQNEILTRELKVRTAIPVMLALVDTDQTNDLG